MGASPKTVSDFEQKILQHFSDNEFDSLFDAAVDYCEQHDVDYEEIHKTVKFSQTFIERVSAEARKNNLLKQSKSTHIELDIS